MPRRRKVSALLGSDPDYARELGSGGVVAPENEARRQNVETIRAEKELTNSVVESNTVAERIAVHLFACPKAVHEQGLEQVLALGIASRDVIRLAGRRASAEFVPSAKFVPASDAELMHSRYAYKTTRLYDAAILQSLRETADPLGIMSDAALLRGQFEPLFWRKLEVVIEELLERTQ